MTLFGNGDIMSFEEYNELLCNAHVDGISVGRFVRSLFETYEFNRAALIKPWIFTEIKEQRHYDISSVGIVYHVIL